MKCVDIKEFGGSDQLIIVDKEIPKPTENQKLLKIKGFGINRAETIQRKGIYPVPQGHSNILGLEAFGTIVGEDQNQYYSALLNGGGYAQFALVHKEHLIPLPKNVNPRDAYGLAEVWLTAYQLIRFVGNLKDNSSVLIYAGASGVGTSLIQLCQQLAKNVKIFYTVSSQEKIDYCTKLGAHHGYNYKQQTYEQICADIKDKTNNKGIDLLLDCVGASNYNMSINSLGLDSTWVQYGLMGGKLVEKFDIGLILGKRITFTGTTLRTRSDQYKADLINSFKKEAIPHFESGKFSLQTDKIIKIDWESNNVTPIKEAHDYMESNQSIGKIIIEAIQQ